MSIKAPLPSYDFPQLAPDKARLFNALCTRAAALNFPFGSSHCYGLAVPDIPSFSPACELELLFGEDLWFAQLSDASILLRHRAFIETGSSGADFSVSDLPDEVCCAVMAALVTPLLEKLQQGLTVPVRLKSVRMSDFTPSHEALAIGFKFCFPSYGDRPELTAFARVFPQESESVPRAAGHLCRLPVRSSGFLSSQVQDAPLEVAFESGYVFVKLAEADALACGDVLIPEHWFSHDGGLMMRLSLGTGKPLVARCTLADGTAVLDEPLYEEQEPVMDSTEQKEIDIRLSFELDRRLITVGELSALAPGYVFSLAADGKAPVTIRANGKAIARGRLVDMDGVLGVQLTETV